MREKELEVWKKLLGQKIQSFTIPETIYLVFLDENGWTCTCMDYKIRKGSYYLSYVDNEGLHTFRGCKHIIKHLRETLKVKIHVKHI